MKNLACSFLFFGLISLFSACNFANSQQVNSDNRIENTVSNVKSDEISAESWEIVRKHTEELNAEPIPQGSKIKQTKPLSREKIRESLIRNGLDGESRNGNVGGAKVVHFSHTCNLFLDYKAFPVVSVNTILQLASSARSTSSVLVFDEKMRLVQNLKVSDQPLFCDGNRLIFNDYKKSIFYGIPEKEIKGNVLIFTDNAAEIQGKSANVNFYRFRDLIH